MPENPYQPPREVNANTGSVVNKILRMLGRLVLLLVLVLMELYGVALLHSLTVWANYLR